MSADKPLPPSVEALLDSVRALDSEPAELRQRALARARAAVSVSVLAPRARFRFGGLGLKLAAAFVVAAAAVSAMTLRIREGHKPEPATLAPKSAQHDSLSLPPPQALPTAQPVAADSSAVLDDDTSAHTAPVVSAHPARERYAQELKVLQPARAAVARGDFSSALASIAEHQRRFPDGQLSEEREALRVQALSGLGRTDEATRAAIAFRKRFPGSVLISRMQALRLAP
jgi:hypothetical protein